MKMNQNAKCQNCGAPANVYYRETVNGKTHEMQLCGKCAEEKKVFAGFGESSFFGDDFFSSMPFFQGFFPQAGLAASAGENCPVCGRTAAQIRASGKMGCPDCYDFFRDQFDFSPFMSRPFRGARLAGRGGEKSREDAGRKPEEESPAARLNRLKKTLKEEVKKENYEKAAELRDEIRRLEA